MTARATRPVSRAPEAPAHDAMPDGVKTLDQSLDRVVARLALRLDEVAAALGVSRSAIERERRAGRFPRHDLTIGRMPLWSPETIRRWIDEGGRP